MAYIETRTLASGEKSHQVVWNVPSTDGKRRRQKETFATRGDAERWLGLLESSGPDVALRALVEANAPAARTVAEQVEHHIEHLTGVDEGTRRDYAAILRRSIAPSLGAIPITILNRDDVARWINAQSDVRPKTVMNRHGLLSAALTSAVRDELIPSNPAVGVRMPRAVEEEMCFLTQDEFARLVRLTPPRWRALVLFLGATALHLFATTSMGIFFGTVARSMPQLGLLIILVLIPLQILSGGTTPRESMPELVQQLMLAAPTTHFVSLAQAILYRGAGLSIVWPQLLAIIVIGSLFFLAALLRFRKTLAQMA